LIMAGSSSIASEITLRKRNSLTFRTSTVHNSSRAACEPGRLGSRCACPQTRRKSYRIRLVAPPNHGHGSRKTAAHIEREEFSHVLDLARAGLFRELLISFEHLANTSRAHRVSVTDQSAAGIHGDVEWRAGFFTAHLR